MEGGLVSLGALTPLALRLGPRAEPPMEEEEDSLEGGAEEGLMLPTEADLRLGRAGGAEAVGAAGGQSLRKVWRQWECCRMVF